MPRLIIALVSIVCFVMGGCQRPASSEGGVPDAPEVARDLPVSLDPSPQQADGLALTQPSPAQGEGGAPSTGGEGEPPRTGSTVSQDERAGGVRGTVFGPDGDPVAMANVTYEQGRVGSATDFDGRYVLNALPAGRRVLTVTYPDFRHSVEVEVKPGVVVDLDIRVD